ncbi:MAG TPA: NAD-dependent epimerase/dehydratase family protein [Elusimicrobiota bacterium]|nr:NAD-dependent epimerase/dehydratase family protein [Elusimicrobiota bacterium]
MAANQIDPSFWRGTPVLVTGGAGFVGSHLVEQLAALGARVRVPHRPGDSLDFLGAVRARIDLVQGDLKDLEFCRKAARGQKTVMNLAAVVGGIEYNIAHPASIFRDNLGIFMNVLEAARLEKVERFLTVSSACVYPRFCSLPTPEEEGFKDVPEPTNQGYGWAKRMEEFLSAGYAQEFGMKIAVARPYNAYGPRDNFDPKSSHVIAALVRRVVEGENPLKVWGNGDNSRSFLYVKDFARGLILTAEKYPEADAVNLGAGEEIRIGDLVRLICRLAGAAPKIVFDSSMPTGQPRRRCDTQKAERVLGFKAEYSLEQGLKETIAWRRAAALARK